MSFSIKTLENKINKLDKKIAILNKETVPLDSTIDFISAIRTNPKNIKRPWEWGKRDYLYNIYNDPAKRMIIVKGRQMEITELAVNMILYHALKYECTVVYAAPSNAYVKRFSSDRLRKAILYSQNNVLKEYVKLPLSNNIIHIGNSTIYLYSAWNDFDILRSIPADYLILDEFQLMDAKSLSVAEEMLTASKLKKILLIGTPLDAGSDFQKEWFHSDKKEWVKDTKTWEPRPIPNNEIFYSGYHISQEMGLGVNIEPGEIETKRRKYAHYRFLNEVLGEFAEGLARPITLSLLRTTFIPEKFPELHGYTYAGVDWGSNAINRAYTWFTITEANYIGGEDEWLYKTTYVEQFEEKDQMIQAKKVADLINKFNVRKTVVDIGFGVAQYQYLRKMFNNRVMACNFISSVEKTFKVDESAFGEMIKADRSTWIEKLLGLIQAGKWKIYTKGDKDLEDLITENFTSLYLEVEQSPSGKDIKRWTHATDGHDDLFMASCYGLMAHELEKRYLLESQDDTIIAFG